MVNKTIAWIEDDIDVINPVAKPLRKAGFVIKEYRTFSDAEENIDEIRLADLILLDLILPRGRSDAKGEYLGLMFLRLLRLQYAVTKPVILFSAVIDAPDVNTDELKKLHAVSLAKPIRPSALKAEVLKLLNVSDKRQ